LSDFTQTAIRFSPNTLIYLTDGKAERSPRFF